MFVNGGPALKWHQAQGGRMVWATGGHPPLRPFCGPSQHQGGKDGPCGLLRRDIMTHEGGQPAKNPPSARSGQQPGTLPSD